MGILKKFENRMLNTVYLTSTVQLNYKTNIDNYFNMQSFFFKNEKLIFAAQ